MAILTYPSIVPRSQDFGIKYNTQVSTSTISGINQTVELPGARWLGSASFTDLTQIESSILKGFLLELRGSSGTFFYGDVTHTDPLLPVSGSPTIIGGSTVRVISITLTSGDFSIGDYVQIGVDDQRELKMVILANNTGGNNWDLTIEPMIRRTDYIGQSVVFSDPVGVFMLTTDIQARWGSRSKALLSDINIEFIEIFQ